MPQVRPRFRALCAGVVLTTGCGLTDLDLDGGAQVTAARIEPGELSIAIDDRRDLALVVVYDDGVEESLTDDVEWSVADQQIARIDNDREVQGRDRGTTELIARFGDVTARAPLTVFAVPQQLEVRRDRGDVPVGLTRQFRAELRYKHGPREDVTAMAAWTSLSPGVATVDVAGVATGVAVGQTEIRASIFELTDGDDLQVRAAVATQLRLGQAATQLAVGQTATFTVMATYSDGNVLDATRQVRWSSSLDAVLSINGEGIATARAPGTATVTATRDEAVATHMVTVVAAAGSP